MKPIIFMTIRNIESKEALFTRVFIAATKISKEFYIVNHWSTDSTLKILDKLREEYHVNFDIQNEVYEWTMDDMKAKHYKLLKKNHQGKYIFALDRDEVLSEELIKEINQVDYKHKVYMIKRDTYFLNKIIRKWELLPLFFEVNSVEINTFAAVHDLYRIHSKDKVILENPMNHFSYETVDEIVTKTLYYSKVEGEELFKKNPNMKGRQLLWHIVKESVIYPCYNLFYFKNIVHVEGILFSLWHIPRVIARCMYYIETKNKTKNAQ